MLDIMPKHYAIRAKGMSFKNYWDYIIHHLFNDRYLEYRFAVIYNHSLYHSDPSEQMMST